MTDEVADAERLRERAPPADRPLMIQTWRHLAFLHWPIDPDAVARLIPPGLSIDTFGGAAYLGIVPFTIPSSRLAGVGLPIAPAFHELNLRTYVHHAGRSPGVWFFSLDAASRLAVYGARIAYHLPYFHARISMHVAGSSEMPTVSFESHRLPAEKGTASFRSRYAPTTTPATVATPGTLEFFLVERYLLYAWTGRHLTSARVHHAPYLIQPASVTDLEETLTQAFRLAPTAGAPALVHYSRQVDVQIFRPHRAPELT